MPGFLFLGIFYFIMKNKLLILSLHFIFLTVFCQKKVIISVRDQSDKKVSPQNIMIASACDKTYMNNYTVLDSSRLKGNEFLFNLKSITDNFPRPYKLGIPLEKNKSYINSEIFYLKDSDQTVKFDSDNGAVKFSKHNLLYDEILKFNTFFSKINSEKNILNRKYYNLIKSTDKKDDSITLLKKSFTQLLNKENSLYEAYVKKNPKSYVLFWNLVFKVNNYQLIYENIFKSFDDSITKSQVGNIFYDKLMTLKYFDNGNVFPPMEVNGKKVTSALGKKYTLIDFWFSYCKPCLEEMPKHKSIYDMYNKDGFEYIGISTDRTQDIPNWQKVITKNNLVWQNLIDENGIETTKFQIKKFPTNFLLDSQGKIIKKDISSEELETFLKNNL